MMKNNLIALRDKIIALDEALLPLLAQRRNLSRAVAQEKQKSGLAVRDHQRETELLTRLSEVGKTLNLDEIFIRKLYQIIIADSVLLQQQLLQSQETDKTTTPPHRISFLGPKGSYSYLAAQQFMQLNPIRLELLAAHSFNEVIQQVESKQSDIAILPIENNSSGAINEVYDLLQMTSLHAVAELIMPIEHALFAKQSPELTQITTLYSHPQPVQQCSQYLAKLPQLHIEYCSSSSAALEKAALSSDPYCGALGHVNSDGLYKLQLIATNISNEATNSTRFILLSHQASLPFITSSPKKITLLMSTAQQAGSLVDILIIFKKYHLSMTKLESRPIRGQPWEVMFYIDLEADIQQLATQQALNEVRQLSRSLKVLGCYPSATPPL